MNTPEGGPRRLVNAEAIEDIKDYANPAIRTMLEEAGAVIPGDPITQEDYEAIKSRAMVLAREKNIPASAETLLLKAFIERKDLVKGAGKEIRQRLSSEALRKYVYLETEDDLTDEEIDMYRKSNLEPREWKQKRDAATEGAGGGYAAANEKDEIVAQAQSPEEAMRQAQDESGR